MPPSNSPSTYTLHRPATPFSKATKTLQGLLSGTGQASYFFWTCVKGKRRFQSLHNKGFIKIFWVVSGLSLIQMR